MDYTPKWIPEREAASYEYPKRTLRGFDDMTAYISLQMPQPENLQEELVRDVVEGLFDSAVEGRIVLNPRMYKGE